MPVFAIIYDGAFGKVVYPSSLKGQDLNQVLAQYTTNNQWRVIHIVNSGDSRSITIFLQQNTPTT